MLKYDLHCHSTHSDGLLSPGAVVARAAAHGVGVLALTDHDEVSGLEEARDAAKAAGIAFIPGSELSVSWRHTTLHVLGLGIDPGHPGLAAGLRAIRVGRVERAKRMAADLERAGIPGSFEGARAYTSSEGLISRTHFARYLVEHGHEKDVRDVFKRYLAPGKPGYVDHEWATLADAVTWIHDAGGQAVLAHPGRYRMSRPDMGALMAQFKRLGGDGIEVHTSSHTSAQYAEYAQFAREYELLASCGSDYHGPGESWMEFGELPALPAGLPAIWKDWSGP